MSEARSPFNSKCEIAHVVRPSSIGWRKREHALPLEEPAPKSAMAKNIRELLTPTPQLGAVQRGTYSMAVAHNHQDYADADACGEELFARIAQGRAAVGRDAFEDVGEHPKGETKNQQEHGQGTSVEVWRASAARFKYRCIRQMRPPARQSRRPRRGDAERSPHEGSRQFCRPPRRPRCRPLRRPPRSAGRG